MISLKDHLHYGENRTKIVRFKENIFFCIFKAPFFHSENRLNTDNCSPFQWWKRQDIVGRQHSAVVERPTPHPKIEGSILALTGSGKIAETKVMVFQKNYPDIIFCEKIEKSSRKWFIGSLQIDRGIWSHRIIPLFVPNRIKLSRES